MKKTMMLWLALTPAMAAQTGPLTISPETLTQCNERGQGTVRLTWRTAERAVQVRVGSAQGAPMTGFEPGSGSAETGDWVSDGLVFVLVNANGTAVARATAQVRCGTVSSNLADQLATQSYLPLDVGNRWIYRFSNRQVTANHLVRTVDRTVVDGGETWYVLRDQVTPGGPATERLYRSDGEGRVYRRVGAVNELFLDPRMNPEREALAVIQQRDLTLTTPMGSLPHGLSYVAQVAPLILQRGTMARGVGFVSTTETLQTGSSGGFTEGLELVEAVIAGKVRFRSPANGLELSPETQVLDLVGRRVRNCALPCYFAACGLGGGTPDPPGTYKPCMFTRLKAENGEARSLRLELINAADETVYSVERALAANPNEQLWFETIPLSGTGGGFLPLGRYRLTATVRSETGEVLNTSTAEMRVQ